MIQYFYNKFNFIFGILLVEALTFRESFPFDKRLFVEVEVAGGIIIHSIACVANCNVVTVVSYDCESDPSKPKI